MNMSQDIKQYHSNGALRSHFDGKIYKEYRADGSLRIEVPCNESGTRYHGVWKLYDHDKLKTTKTYVEGRVLGDVCQYYSNGQLKSQVYMKQDWNNHLWREGESKTWNAVGVLTSECNFVNDKLHGELKRWDDKGQLIEHKMFDNGVEVEQPS